jgi:hypothetical protein
MVFAGDQALKAKLTLSIRIRTGQRTAPEQQLNHDLVGWEVAPGYAKLADNIGQFLLLRTKRGGQETANEEQK